jgi:hypothetical protein
VWASRGQRGQPTRPLNDEAEALKRPGRQAAPAGAARVPGTRRLRAYA